MVGAPVCVHYYFEVLVGCASLDSPGKYADANISHPMCPKLVVTAMRFPVFWVRRGKFDALGYDASPGGAGVGFWMNAISLCTAANLLYRADNGSLIWCEIT